MILPLSFVRSSLFRKIELQLLMDLTARALRQPSQRLWTLSNGRALQAYAEFTNDTLQKAAVFDTYEIHQRLSDEAYKMGHLLRRLLFIRKTATAAHLIIALYRNIGITLSFTDDEHLCFHRCFFSHYYTPAVCLAASALDDGIIRGILDQPASRLRFQQRITEGCPCCLATFRQEAVS